MNELEIKENIKIENMIYEVRGKQVMLDSDLARLYKCANGTKAINLAVKRNCERFPKDFYFQLTEEESGSLRFQNETSKQKSRGGRTYLAYVFTEEGVDINNAKEESLSYLDELDRLKKLYDEKAITKAEYDKKKKEKLDEK